MNTDVSALKRAEQALRETQERLRVLNDIAGSMARMLELDDVRRLAVHALSRTFRLLRVSIASVDERGHANVTASAGCELLPGLIGRTLDLARTREAAERANQAKSEFLTNMSHELRTPMHAILSFARLGIEKIAQGRMEAHKLQQYFGRIDQSGERLLALLNDLLDLSKLESGRMDYDFGAHDVMVILRAAVQEFSALAASAGVQIGLQGDAAGRSRAQIDPGRLGQVVRNLLSNAIKFTPVGGTVRIDLREAPAPADMHAGRVLQIRVTDSGVGIPRHEMDAIFQKFVQSSTTRSNAGGTGLGLAICREIVHAHGGQIWVESELGRGSTFIVGLPLSEASSADAGEDSMRREMAEPSAEEA